MSRYFTHFPKIRYDDEVIRDITRRTNFVQSNLANPFMFLPYTTKSDEKPEDVALYYYGSVDYTWIVLMANNIIDPYHEWIMSDETFNKYLIAKYQEASGAKDYDVIRWTQNTLITENILYYYKYLGNDFGNAMEKISVDSIDVVENPGSYIPYRIYDFEHDTNENRREIKLIDKRYIDQITKEFKGIMNER